jgi:hypothetical protein
MDVDKCRTGNRQLSAIVYEEKNMHYRYAFFDGRAINNMQGTRFLWQMVIGNIQIKMSTGDCDK